MRKAFYCLAAGAFGLGAAGYLADTARSDVHEAAFGTTVSIERASKGDRLPAFAASAIRTPDAGVNRDETPAQNITVIARRPIATDVQKIEVRPLRDEGKSGRELDEVRSKKRGNKMMVGCEASVSPLSPASAQASASRCVA